MANDYWGYMPEYRDYRSFDHYRKALNGLGPHGADFLNTRMARMAANLNGATAAMPDNPLDAVFQVESARAQALSETLGELARAYTTIYEATLPDDGGTPAIRTQPEDIKRFSAAKLEFVGGSNYNGSPEVRVERQVAGAWQTYGTQDGEVQLQLAFMPSAASLPTVEIPLADEGLGAVLPDPQAYALWRAGQFEWIWTATFEAFVSELSNLGNRPGVTPAGTYRFVVNGQHRGAGDYQLISETFEVRPWGGITVEDLSVRADRRVSLRAGPRSERRVFKDRAGTGDVIIPDHEPGYLIGPVDYPDSYTGGLSWIRNEKQLFRYGPGRADDQLYCGRCTFRPWADSANVASVTLTVRRADSSTYTMAAEAAGDRWVSAAPLAPGEIAYVAPGGIVDQYGEINGTKSAETSASIAGNRAPIADAGKDFSVSERSGVTLNGTGSRDPDGELASYAWTQLAGPLVSLTAADTAQPRFTAPDVTGNTVLTFRLTVADAQLEQAADDISITVVPAASPPPAFDICDPVDGEYCLSGIPVLGELLLELIQALMSLVEPLLGGSDPTVPPLPNSDGVIGGLVAPVAGPFAAACHDSGVFEPACVAAENFTAAAGLSRYVDPRIGSFPPGFTNPGPVAPFGMVALGPDTEGPLNYGGYYQHNALVTGFSHVHMTAGVFKGGQFPLMPFTGERVPGDLSQLGYPQPVPAYASDFRARVGSRRGRLLRRAAATLWRTDGTHRHRARGRAPLHFQQPGTAAASIAGRQPHTRRLQASVGDAA